MDNFFLAVLTSIIPSIIVAVITAFITVKLSTKSFYTKRWWEKKVELYSIVIKRLTYLKKYVLKWHDSSEDKIVLDNIELNKFIKKYDEERDGLREIESYGRLIISKRANERLINCMDELDNYDINNENGESIKKYLNGCLNILESCIDDFINYAKEDLELNE